MILKYEVRSAKYEVFCYVTPPLYAVVVFLWYGAGMSAIEFSGVEFTFSQLSGEARVFEWEFLRDGRPMDVADVVFSGVVLDADEAVVGDVVCEHVSDEVGVIRVSFPRLDVGTYGFEVRYQSAAGDVGRVVFGRIGVEASALVLEEFFGEERDRQRLALNVPREAGGQLVLEWRSASIGSAAAERALEAAEKLAGLDATLERFEAQVEEFRVFTVKWHNDIKSVLVMNAATGTIWVDGHDTGQRYRGADGLAPRVNAYGFWETFDGVRWNALPYKAVGRDGVDGDQVRRVLAGSAAEVLAKPEERGVYYFVPADDGYDVFAWVEPVGWLNVGREAYGVAESDSLGLVMLGTDVPVVNGAPVGVKGLQLHVPLASDSVPGSVRASSPVVSDAGGGLHMSASGSLLADVATGSRFGCVMLSADALVESGGAVGVGSDGRLRVPLATFSAPGVVKPGSSYAQLESIPYIMAVGVDGAGNLANCLVRGGALKHMQPGDWSGAWIEEGAFPTDGAHYLGLDTSDQFTQSRGRGLELLPATEERVAGVRFSRGRGDDGEGSVLCAADAARRDEVAAVADEVMAAVDDCYRKAECDELFMSTKGGCVAVQVCKKGMPTANNQAKGVLYIGL